MSADKLLPGALVLLLLPALALANDLGWSSFAASCRTELNPAWAEQVTKGKSWETASDANQRGLLELSEKICPEYLKHPNDSDAIRAFGAKKNEVLDQSPVLEKDGQALNLFLVIALREYQATFAEAGIDFSRSRCARHLKKTASLTRQRLDVIQARIKALAETCFSGTAKEAAATVKLKHSELPQNGKTLAAPNGKGTKAKSSDITGTEKKTPSLQKQ